jgi:hypothetical protein
MSTRSKELAQQFKAKQEAQELSRKEETEAIQTKNAKVVLDAKTLTREAPKIWEKLCGEFVKQCDAVNAEPGVGNILLVTPQNNNQILVSRTGGHNPSVRVSFGLNDYSIKFGGLYQPIKTPGSLRMKVLPGDSEPSIVSESDGRTVDLESVVDACICGLLGLR